MNSNQRYYAFLALTSNQDFVEEIQQLRKDQSFSDYDFPIDGFENPADADAFVLAQKKALQDRKLLVNKHPLWKLEQDLVMLMEKYGLQAKDDKHLYEIARHYFYLNTVMLSRDRFKLNFDRKNHEVHIILKQESTKSDVKDNLDMIFDYKDKILGKKGRKSEIFYFEEQLAFYKLFLRLKQQNPELTNYKIIKIILDLIRNDKNANLPKVNLLALDDERRAYQVIESFEEAYSDLKLLSSLEESSVIETTA